VDRKRRPVWTGYAVRSLEAVLWAFETTENYRNGCLVAVNLGDDADTTAAVYGQVAGAHYGEATISATWRGRLALNSTLDRVVATLAKTDGA
jgi:ADP-ribosyl-[dinitrogen reductase] hydrolase